MDPVLARHRHGRARGLGSDRFPLEAELRLGSDLLHADWSPASAPGLVEWVDRIREGLIATNDAYPFLSYDTDWLAFAHLMIAIAFAGPLRDPIRNVWIVQWGMIMCAAVVAHSSRARSAGFARADAVLSPLPQIPRPWCTPTTARALCTSVGRHTGNPARSKEPGRNCRVGPSK